MSRSLQHDADTERGCAHEGSDVDAGPASVDQSVPVPIANVHGQSTSSHPKGHRRRPFKGEKSCRNTHFLPYAAMHTSPPAKRPARAVQVYETVKRQLLAGDFPLGFRLGEVAIAEAIGVSRTPVREALSRLHAEGLVVRLPEGGFSPATPDLPTISDLYEVRRGLEFTAIHRGGHDRVMLEDLRSDWGDVEVPGSDEDCTPDFVLRDEDFHVRLAAAAGNEPLVDMLVTVNERIRVVRVHDFLTADRVRATVDEHVGILDALLDDDEATASNRLSRHLEISEQVVEQRAAIVISRMIGRRSV